MKKSSEKDSKWKNWMIYFHKKLERRLYQKKKGMDILLFLIIIRLKN